MAVIREVLANSFAHAVYNGRTNHEICIHPGMITIYSPGEYASNHKPEDYMKGNYESVIRNATIAKILYLNKSIEQFGSGFKRINSLCKDSGIRFSYESDELGFKFILYRAELQSDIPRITLDGTLNGSESIGFFERQGVYTVRRLQTRAVLGSAEIISLSKRGEKIHELPRIHYLS